LFSESRLHSGPDRRCRRQERRTRRKNLRVGQNFRTPSIFCSTRKWPRRRLHRSKQVQRKLEAKFRTKKSEKCRRVEEGSGFDDRRERPTVFLGTLEEKSSAENVGTSGMFETFYLRIVKQSRCQHHLRLIFENKFEF